MKRRDFIKHSSCLTAGFAIGGSLSAKVSDPVLGQHDKRYRLNTKWSQADAARYPVKDCHEMVQDKQGRILLLTNETKNNVIIYDKKGKLINTWGDSYPGAHGFTLFNENGPDVLYIADNNLHQIIKTDINGKVLMKLNYPAETGAYEKETEYIPTETAIAANGDIYVADGYGKDYIIQYDRNGKYIRHFGGKGTEDKHLSNAHGICLDYRDKANPVLIVSSRKQNAFKRFTLDGNYIDTIALPGAWVCRPVIKGDYLYAAVLKSNSKPSEASGFVTVLDKNFKVVSNLGGSAPVYEAGKLQEMVQTEKVFQYPHDVCIDDEGNMYVAQWNSGKVYPYKLEAIV